MHSSTLGDSDFEIIASGQPVELAEYFSGFTNTKRLGGASAQSPRGRRGH